MDRLPRRTPCPGFTLIELLIFVSVVALLLALAAPNFNDAEIRARTARVHVDHRTLLLGCEIFRADHGRAPDALVGPSVRELQILTTPIAYIAAVPPEVFESRDKNGLLFNDRVYDYTKYQQLHAPTLVLRGGGAIATSTAATFVLVSTGPNNLQEEHYIVADIPGFLFSDHTYDPTNGTLSAGDIYTFGCDSQGR